MQEGPSEPNQGLDVTEMRAMLLLAKRARRRQNAIRAFKLLLGLALIAGLGFALLTAYRHWTAA